MINEELVRNAVRALRDVDPRALFWIDLALGTAPGVSRYAERHALLAHRNVCESLFNALKAGHGIATVGADRLRLNDFDTVHALVDLSFCMSTALMLGHKRDKYAASHAVPLQDQLAA